MAASYSVGLDIGFAMIKALVLSHKGKSPKLESLASIVTPQPGMTSDSDLDLEAVARSIKQLLDNIKAPTNEVTIALPESKVFTRVITDLPYLSDEEITSSIRYSAEEFVPLPSDQVNLNWEVIQRSKPKNQTQVFVVASPKSIVHKYIKLMSMAELKPLALETEIIAATRSLVGNNRFSPTTLIIQLGATTTDFAVVSQGYILLTRSIATGGVALTRQIAQYLNFELTQAEEYKKTYGLLEDQLGGKIYQVLKPLTDIILSETKRVIQSFQMRNQQNLIKRVVLTGGGAKIPGGVIYFANGLGLEVQEADPWSFIEVGPAVVPKLSQEAPLYTVAAGLALREV